MSNNTFLNKSNIEVTNVTIPDNEKLENINLFLQTMNMKLTNTKNINPNIIIKALNEKKQIQILGVRNKSYALAKQLGWKMYRIN